MSGGHGGGRNKRHEEHEEHEEHVNHEAWVIPYADLLTLLMALFLVLFAIGRTDLEKFKKLSEGMQKEFGAGSSTQVVSIGTGDSTSPLDGGSGVLDGRAGNVGGEPTNIQIEQARQEAEQKKAQEAVAGLKELEAVILDQAEGVGVGDKVAFRFEGRGLVLTILNEAVLFRPGQATLQPDGLQVLDLVANSLRDIPNDLAIEGHTDSRPISTTRFASNWELSTARATQVLRHLEGLAGWEAQNGRLSASGYGDTRPIADNATVEGQARNRRVEIVIVSDISLQPALQIDL